MFSVRILVFSLCVLAVLANDSSSEDDHGNGNGHGNGGNKSIVHTKYGKLRGFQYTLDRSNGQKADIFLGVPYAKPPVGPLRFEKTVEVQSWNGIRDATHWGLPCAPDSMAGTNLSASGEDCLFINIFRPSKGRNAPKAPREGYPVVVWIHGGLVIGNQISFGYANLSNNFIPYGIIVVTLQYRLGPFGWASTGDSVMPGNWAYWDQTQALKFLTKTIGQFGGNPKKITIFGLSSGATSANALAISPHSRDMVVATVEQSGNVFQSCAANDEVIGATLDFAAALGCTRPTSAQIKACLKTKTVMEIFVALNVSHMVTRDDNINFVNWQPRLDGHFFPKNFTELTKEAPPKPSLQGVTVQEGIFYTLFGFHFSRFTPFGIPKPLWPTFLEANFTAFVRQAIVGEAFFGPQAPAAANDIIAFYSRNKPADHATNFSFWITQYTEIMSDVVFNIPNLWSADAKRAAGWPAYMYQDEHYNEALFNNQYVTDSPVKGSFHVNEYPYQFALFPFSTFEFDETEKKMQKVLISTIASMVKTGNPTTLSNIPWPKMSNSEPYSYLSIKPDPVFNHAPLMHERMVFWNNLTANYPFNVIFHTVD